jgi:hypothetical protein
MRLPTPLRRLFEAPVTDAYTGFALLLIILSGRLVLFPNTLPNVLKYLLMLATLGWLARFCDSPGQRGVWLASVGLLLLGLTLEGSALPGF